MLDKHRDLIITRKRKLYKFAHFKDYKNCYSFMRGDIKFSLEKSLSTWFSDDNPRILEIAAGNAQFSLNLAKKYPNLDFVAADIKSDRLYTSAKQALEQDINNIVFTRINMQELKSALMPESIQTIWLTFPDPYLRKRSVRRRLTHPDFLNSYKKLLTKNGDLKFKTDNRELFLWSLEQFVGQKWKIKELSFDLHESNLPDDYKIKTYYEEKYTKNKIPINFATISKD